MKFIISIGFFLLLPILLWLTYPPIRVFAPNLAMPLILIDKKIYIEDEKQAAQARQLYQDALNFIATQINPIQDPPTVIFCNTAQCFQRFGFIHAEAQTVSRFGIVLGPRAWQPYHLRHEMIHHLQIEQLGWLTAWTNPSWFTEGMAYSLSRDPRSDLGEPWQTYREQFEIWQNYIPPEQFWQAAAQL